MSEAVLISRIKEMKCGSKTIPQEYIDCFNDYIEKVINIRVDEELAGKFELGKFKSVNDLVCAYKNLEKVFTKSRQKITDLEAQLAESESESNARYSAWQEEIRECDRLREQLAEKEKEHELLIDQFEEETEKLRKQIKQESDARKRFVEEVKNLKQQLSEKEKKYQDLKEIDDATKESLYASRGYIDEMKSKMWSLEQSQNQTAIAELEKVKKLLKHKGFVLKVKPPITMPTTSMNEYLKEFMILEDDFDRVFDQQIKLLKGEK